MNFKSTTKPGFTIVELLIVIVVIGILAAITIVAYNGVQDRARNAALKSEMNQLQKRIQVDALQQDGESISLKAPLAYGTGVGTWSLSEPQQNSQQITLYSVFDTSNNLTANWASIAQILPATSNNTFSIRTVASSSNGVQGLWQTSAQTNQAVGTANGVRDTTGRHVGWMTTNGSTISAGFDNGAGASVAPTAHSGWTFDKVTTSSPAGIAAVAVLIFPEYHDATTRTQVLRWLDRQHTIDYYN